MVQAIDWRLRPPYRSFKGSILYDKYGDNPEWPESVTKFSMDALIKEMDEAGIGIGMVSMRAGNDNHDIDLIKQEYPGRFLGMAHINPCDGAKALADIDEFVINGAADTIIMEPGQFFIEEPMPADDPRLYPIYEKCEKENIIVTLTFGGLFCAKLENYNPIFIDRIAVDFPKLKIVITHGGWPYVTEICHVGYQRKNVNICPDYYMFNFNPGYDQYVLAANHILKNQILFGSCFPSKPLDFAMQNIQNIGLTPDALEHVLYHNSARLLGLEK